MTFLHATNYPTWPTQYVNQSPFTLIFFYVTRFRNRRRNNYFIQKHLIFSVIWNGFFFFLFFFLVLSGVVYFLFGYILTSSNGGAADKFIGTTFEYPDELMLYLNIFFHSLFASITSSIVAGALAERCKLISHFVYCVFISGM